MTVPTDPLIQPPVGGSGGYLLVVLHGRGRSAEEELEHWKAAEREGWIVAARSSQRLPAGSSWDDPARSQADVLTALRVARSRISQPDLPVLISGFSQGAGLAVVLAAKRRLSGLVGFIAVAPSAGWARELLGPEEVSTVGLRGWIVTGELDARRDDCRALGEQLRNSGAKVRIDVIAGLEHDYPADFEERLSELTVWVLGRPAQGNAR